MKTLTKFAELCQTAGGNALLVGGSVRDRLWGLEPKDLDVEVYGLPPEKVKELAASLGPLNEVGAAFGILKLSTDESVIDISLPRRESKIGNGHKDFSIDADPFMSIAEASRRRDFTMNSLSQDILTGEIIDPWSGLADVRNKILRVTSALTFVEDPLRVMRAVQFVSRFDLSVEPMTFALMRRMIIEGELKHLPKERLREEWSKLFHSPKPSAGLQLAMSIGIFDEFPFIKDMKSTSQEPEWHPEGDVWTHTKMVSDVVAKSKQLVVKIASFCHDFGKVDTTELIDGRVRSRGHAEAGVKPTKQWLTSIGFADLIPEVTALVASHLSPTMLFLKKEEIRTGTIKRLARRIAPATLEQLAEVSRADHLGRGPFGDLGFPDECPGADWLLEKARELGIERAQPEPIIKGRDLISLGLKPGPLFGKIIAGAEEHHLDTGADREELLEWIKETYANN